MTASVLWRKWPVPLLAALSVIPSKLLLRRGLPLRWGVAVVLRVGIATPGRIGIDIVVPGILLLVLAARAICINIDIYISIRIPRGQNDGIHLWIGRLCHIPFSADGRLRGTLLTAHRSEHIAILLHLRP